LAIIELVDNPREREAIEAEKKRKAAATKKKKTDSKKASGRSKASEDEETTDATAKDAADKAVEPEE
jgi:hypothetical protein